MSFDIKITRRAVSREEESKFWTHIRQKYEIHPGKFGIYRVVFDTSYRKKPMTLGQIKKLAVYGVYLPDETTIAEADEMIKKLSGKFSASCEVSEGNVCLNKHK